MDYSPTRDFTQQEIDLEIQKINKLSRYEMASLRRFAPSGHIYFDMSYGLECYVVRSGVVRLPP